MADEPSYRVQWSRKVIDALKELGGGKELARVVRDLDERLRRDPLRVGEVYRSRGSVEEHLAVQEFVAIDFAVDTERNFVLVRTCQLLSGQSG